MKKIILTAAAVFALTFANAQAKKESKGGDSEGGFKMGINVGLPLGNIKDAYSLGLGVDLAYLWPISEGFQLGVTTGYAHYLGKTQDYDTGFGIVSIIGTFISCGIIFSILSKLCRVKSSQSLCSFIMGFG